MVRGIYIAASGMMAQEAKQSAISNNLANASTPGFKRDIAVGESFSDIVSGFARSPIGHGHVDCDYGSLLRPFGGIDGEHREPV